MTNINHNNFEIQSQPEPGLESKMIPKPDDGSSNYNGHKKLVGKKALITGGDSGIGRAVAIAFAHEGADIVLNYLPEEESDAQEVKQIVEKIGGNIYLIPGDLKSEKFNHNLVEQAVKLLGHIDILALIAGKQQSIEKIDDLTTQQLIDTYTTNVFSLVWLIKAAKPYISKGGSIINTSSLHSDRPSSFLIDYAGTKSAIRNMTISLAQQFSDYGIRVNCVAPGPTWTALQVAGGRPIEQLPSFGKNTILNRAGQPREIATAYVYLASNESSFINGECIKVNGGLA